ncbi:MAG: sugar ABC transporter permease [Clostridia bacterium]|nr:sugar ABC transporter permease [Clostridia bacterium]
MRKITRKTEKQKKNSLTVLAKNASGWGLIFPSIFLFVMIVWRPILIGISYSFFSLQGFTPTEFVGLDNFRQVLSDTNFTATLKNTIAYVGWSFLIGFPLPFVCAVLMNELIHGQRYFKLTTYLPVIIPSIATSMIWKMVYMNGEGGLLNMLRYSMGLSPIDWLGTKTLTIPLIVISMSWNAFGSTLIIYLASLQSINQELYEAARLDGAGFFSRIVHVLLPHMRGILLLNGIRQIISVFNVTEQPLAMTDGGPNGASMSLGLTNYFYAFKYSQYNKSMALGVITFALLLVLTFVYFALDKRMEE